MSVNKAYTDYCDSKFLVDSHFECFEAGYNAAIKNMEAVKTATNTQSTPCSCKTTVTIHKVAEYVECDNCGDTWLE